MKNFVSSIGNAFRSLEEFRKLYTSIYDEFFTLGEFKPDQDNFMEIDGKKERSFNLIL